MQGLVDNQQVSKHNLNSTFCTFQNDCLDFETPSQIPGEDQGFQETGGGGRGDRSSQPRQVSTGDIL